MSRGPSGIWYQTVTNAGSEAYLVASSGGRRVTPYSQLARDWEERSETKKQQEFSLSIVPMSGPSPES